MHLGMVSSGDSGTLSPMPPSLALGRGPALPEGRPFLAISHNAFFFYSAFLNSHKSSTWRFKISGLSEMAERESAPRD